MLLAGAASRLTVEVADSDKPVVAPVARFRASSAPIAVPHDARWYPSRFHHLAAPLWSIASSSTAPLRLPSSLRTPSLPPG
jgi:hypothetical protein